MGDKPRRRADSVTDAASFLGVSRQRLQQFQKESPWWLDEFRSSEGFDVVGIALAQQEWHLRDEFSRAAATSTTPTATEERIAEANEVEAVESARIKRLERRKRERIEAVEGKRLVPASVAVSFASESQAELRVQLTDLAYRFWLQCPDEFKPLVFSEDESQPAVLQLLVEGVVEGYEAFLEMAGDEMFDSDDEFELEDGEL